MFCVWYFAILVRVEKWYLCGNWTFYEVDLSGYKAKQKTNKQNIKKEKPRIFCILDFFFLFILQVCLWSIEILKFFFSVKMKMYWKVQKLHFVYWLSSINYINILIHFHKRNLLFCKASPYIQTPSFILTGFKKLTHWVQG